MTRVVSSQGWWRVAAEEVWLPTASEMSELDRVAVAAIPERALIENAGRAVALQLHEHWPTGGVAVLAGSGHNGADALVAGRTLGAWGRRVEVIRCGSRLPEPDVLAGWPIEVRGPEDLGAALAGADVVVDGILGTGLTTAPRDAQARLIEQLNRSRARVVSVDGPSGVDFSTGRVPGVAVRADLTVSLGWPKLGLLRFPARPLCGDILCAEIGFPPPDPLPRARAITASWAASILGTRGADAHKGRAGYAAVLGGRPGMAGAVVLAARAAIRAGAGIVRVVSAPENREIVQTAVPAAVFVGWDEPEAVRETLEWAHAVAIGPGLGGAPDDRGRAREALGAAHGPVVLDADGLNMLEGDMGALHPASGRGVLLTPHPGEMARLAGAAPEEIRAEPDAVAGRLAAAARATVVLKGTPSWVASPDGSLRVTTLLSPVFAAGGMGDVLTGASAAYLAGGLAPADAATVALTVTAIAALSGHADVGGSAADVPDAIPAARASLREVTPGRWGGVSLALPAAEGGR